MASEVDINEALFNALEGMRTKPGFWKDFRRSDNVEDQRAKWQRRRDAGIGSEPIQPVDKTISDLLDENP